MWCKLLYVCHHVNNLIHLTVTLISAYLYGKGRGKCVKFSQETVSEKKKKRIGHYAEDIKDLSCLPQFLPTTASAQSVQVEGSRWERSNECKDAGHDPHYQHFASGRAKNRHSCSQRVKPHQFNVTFLSRFPRALLSTKRMHTHTHVLNTLWFKLGALLLLSL